MTLAASGTIEFAPHRGRGDRFHRQFTWVAVLSGVISVGQTYLFDILAAGHPQHRSTGEVACQLAQRGVNLSRDTAETLACVMDAAPGWF